MKLNAVKYMLLIFTDHSQSAVFLFLPCNVRTHLKRRRQFYYCRMQNSFTTKTFKRITNSGSA